MTVSEQEVKNQVAEMRAALDSIHASARIGSVVKVIGVLVGFGIVAWLLLGSWHSRIKPLKDPDLWTPILQERGKLIVDNMRLKDQLPKLAKEVGETYKEEGMTMAKGLDLQGLADTELRAFLDDVRPIVSGELERVRPQVESLLRAEGERLLDDLQNLVDDAVNQRLAGILSERQDVLRPLVAAESLDELIRDIRSAAEGAAESLARKSLKRYEDETDKIMDLMEQIPPLPGPRTQGEMIHDLTRALLARVKFELPDAQEVLAGEGR